MPNHELNEMVLIAGTIEDVSGTTDPTDPNLSKAGKALPLRLSCKSEENELIEIIVWLNEERFPPQIEKINLDTIKGKAFRANAKYNGLSTYNSLPVYEIRGSKGYQFQIANGSSPKQRQEEDNVEYEEVPDQLYGGTYMNPVPKTEKKPLPKQQPVQPQPAVQTDKDTLIVDQVLFKGAIDLRAAGVEVVEASAIAITLWNHIRSRHIRDVDTYDDDDDEGESFGAIQLGGE
jgi:hypothetical protein